MESNRVVPRCVGGGWNRRVREACGKTRDSEAGPGLHRVASPREVVPAAKPSTAGIAVLTLTQKTL